MIINLDRLDPEELINAFNDERNDLMRELLCHVYHETTGNLPTHELNLLQWFIDNHEYKDDKWKYVLR